MAPEIGSIETDISAQAGFACLDEIACPLLSYLATLSCAPISTRPHCNCQKCGAYRLRIFEIALLVVSSLPVPRCAAHQSPKQWGRRTSTKQLENVFTTTCQSTLAMLLLSTDSVLCVVAKGVGLRNGALDIIFSRSDDENLILGLPSSAENST